MLSRIVTALVLAPLVVYAVLNLSAQGFLILLTVAFIISAWEWLGLCGLKSDRWQFLLSPILIAPALVAILVPQASSGLWIRIFSIWWLLVPLLIALMQWKKQFVSLSSRSRILLGMGALSAVILSLYQLRGMNNGQYWVLTVLAAVWGADIGAYFTGKLIGGPKLASFISPGKTWAGFFGGLVGGSLAIIVMLHFFFPEILLTIPLMSLILISVIVSVGGDLWISVLKRISGIKDSGHILPGHGGLLDRLDSLIACSPVLLTGLIALGIQ
ncbi:MAG: phosphatidate cytidylyltransferase [bacterium]